MQAGLKTISRMPERRERERALKQPRACANDTTATFVVALAEAVRRRRAIINDGTAIDLLTVAPKTAVAWWIGQFSVLQTNSSVKPRSEVPSIHWKGPRLLLRARRLESWSFWQRHKVKLASEATWARQELRNRLRRNKARCQLCLVPTGTLCHRCFTFPLSGAVFHVVLGCPQTPGVAIVNCVSSLRHISL